MDEYKLIQQIGEGSFGRVFKARRKYTGRMVAIKTIQKGNMKDEDLVNFRREVDILKKVDHPNIMRLLEYFETDSEFCLVTELGRGDLFQIISDTQRLPEEQLKPIAAQLVSALNHLHQKKIIHRDLKPQNILVSDNSSIKLCDFGFARALSRTTLVLNSIKGTPLYMAPELVQEYPYTEKIDIWSLGIILYELYYGKPPYFTDSMYNLIKMIINEPITWPGPISDEFKDFILKALVKDPDSRWSCEQLLNHPWIAYVDLRPFDDSFYRFKNEEFESALKDQDFRPPTSRPLDFQDVLMSPTEYPALTLCEALNELENADPLEQSPLANTFAMHIPYFIQCDETADQATNIAVRLLNIDPSRYSPYVSAAATKLLSTNPTKHNTLKFLSLAIIIPYAQCRIAEEEVVPPTIPDEICQKLHDELLGSLTTLDTEDTEILYTLLVYLIKVSAPFGEKFSQSAAQTLPILSFSVIKSPGPIISCCALTLIAAMVARDENCFNSIAPISEFVQTLFKLLDDTKPHISSFCLYSSALFFCQASLSQLNFIPDFQNKVTNVSARKDIKFLSRFLCGGDAQYEVRLKSLLSAASSSARSEKEILFYAAVFGSPFRCFNIDEKMLQSCIEKLPMLLPIHQAPLLSSILSSVPSTTIIPLLPSMIDIFNVPTCTHDISEFVLSLFEENKKEIEIVRESLCVKGLIPSLCKFISSDLLTEPSSEVLLLVQLVLSFPNQTKILKNSCQDVLQALLANDFSRESFYIVASHYARLSHEYISLMQNTCNILELSLQDLENVSPFVRRRCCHFLGNVWRQGGRPNDFSDKAIPKLVKLASDNDEDVCASACYALSNAVYHTSDVGGFIVPSINEISDLLLKSNERAVECSASLISNLVSKGELYTRDVIKKELIDKLLNASETEEGVMRVLSAFHAIAGTDEGKKLLKNSNAIKVLQKVSKSAGDNSKITINALIHYIEM
ncbi:CAMK family protein kinase [Trichomonas vaginalis G3]|uniref:non-specific serine/threonine protein kinase n=1 Tax=Trichomonas vaginalis (strain ATCC PRA-98 / G3) TaxID=412133 RepID=A2EUZ8_TRIV3|nr:protein kinase related family [Trichomonas vaginalis G3]EAY03521.1 CAMK family protein kinase [Trichomonas vaginalis G3]KAI5537493.1 protein kinase related family [Trichomonas vaginalis G3]|eukprot:XP_001315744.1 CAMK family protein kinase [Trichomonas vaginalis G3]